MLLLFLSIGCQETEPEDDVPIPERGAPQTNYPGSVTLEVFALVPTPEISCESLLQSSDRHLNHRHPLAREKADLLNLGGRISFKPSDLDPENDTVLFARTIDLSTGILFAQSCQIVSGSSIRTGRRILLNLTPVQTPPT